MVLRETPTVTYTPVSGERFAKSLLSPLPPVTLLAMIEAGWASDLLFRMTVRGINGVNNTSRAPLFEQNSSPAFLEAMGAMRRLQRSGALSLRMRQVDRGLFRGRPHLSQPRRRPARRSAASAP